MSSGDIKIHIPVPLGGERGDIPDHQLDANFFRELSNFYIDVNGNLCLREGYLPLAATGPTGRIMGMRYFRTAAGVDVTVAANRTELHYFNGSTWTDVTGGTALTSSTSQLSRFIIFPTSGVFNILHVNGKDAPQYGIGSTAFADLGGSPPTGIDVSHAANRVLMLVNPDNIRISDFNNPQVWPSGLTVRLTSGDRMLGLERLGRLSVAIYGEDTQWIARAQLGSFPFRFEMIDEKPGPLSKATVVKDGNNHYYLGVDGVVYRFDGINVVPWHRGMQSYLQTNVNLGNREMCHGVLVRRIRHIFWFFPLATSEAPNAGVYLDLDRRAMGRITIGEITASTQWQTIALTTWADLSAFTWNDIAATFPTWKSFGTGSEPTELLGDTGGQVQLFSSGSTSDNGSPVSGSFELPLRPWAGPDKNFIPLEFESFFRKTTNSVTITPAARASDTLMVEQPSLTTLTTFDITTNQRNSVDLSSVTGGEGRRFVSIRHAVSTDIEAGRVIWLGGMLNGSEAEAPGGPTGTT